MPIFNRLRLQAIQTVKTRKYLMYALGEIVIIVIGIFIALNLNNWNDKGHDRAIEIKTLEELKYGLVDDLIDIRLNLTYYRAGKKSSDLLKAHIKNNLPYHDSLDIHFGKFTLFAILLVRTGPFETLKSRGMETITNDSLRLKIASIYDINYKHLNEFQKGFDYQNAYDNKKMYLTKFKDWRLHKSATPLNYKKLKNNNEFLNLLNFTSDSQAISIYQYQLAVTKCVELISEIEQEINRLRKKTKPVV